MGRVTLQRREQSIAIPRMAHCKSAEPIVPPQEHEHRRQEPDRLYHYRDRDQRDVGLIIERFDGSIVAVEIKAAASIHVRDFNGIKHLRDKLGSRFVAGALLYTGSDTLPVDDRIAAVPLSGLWSSE